MKFARNPKISPVKAMVICGLLLGPVYIIPQDILNDAVGTRVVNIFTTLTGVFYGLAILQIIWNLEKYRSRGTIFFAWCYFVVQHLAFGFGGFLESLSDFNYTYSNQQGSFPFDVTILPLTKVHLAAMTAGLLGVWLATRAGVKGKNARKVRLPERVWSWEKLRFFCYSLLFLHAALIVVAPELKLTGTAAYVLTAISGPANATPVLWGLIWERCKRKSIFLVYFLCFGLFEVIRGGRTAFVSVAALFLFGFITSGAATRVRLRNYVALSALTLVLGWAFLQSENIRVYYERGTPGSVSDATDRIESIGSSDGDTFSSIYGGSVNGVFRLASRIFEASAADVITRTPDAVPFWGWTSEDTDVLASSILPLGLRRDAAFFSSERNGVFYLRAYGWYVDPFGEERGTPTSMPATLVGDSWRRFGWPGIIACFAVLSWILAKLTPLLRFGPNQPAKALFSAALLSEVVLWYTADIVYLATSVPRRLVIMAMFTVALTAVLPFLRAQVQSARPRKSAPGPFRPVLDGWPKQETGESVGR